MLKKTRTDSKYQVHYSDIIEVHSIKTGICSNLTLSPVELFFSKSSWWCPFCMFVWFLNELNFFPVSPDFFFLLANRSMCICVCVCIVSMSWCQNTVGPAQQLTVSLSIFDWNETIYSHINIENTGNTRNGFLRKMEKQEIVFTRNITRREGER